MLLEITHENVFEYGEPVTESYMEFRLTPLTDSSQHLLQHRHRVEPSRTMRQYVDALGNTVSYFNILPEHERVEVSFDSIVETNSTRFRGHGIPAVQRDGAAALRLLYDYLRPTPLTEWCEEFRQFIQPMERLKGSPPQEAADVVRETIFSSFRYEGEVTSVSSPITDILRHGGGVCQDFAHLMLASCRWLGFPARYVSGYVVLEGREEEVNASHAWVEVFDPAHGWFGIDPTHNQWVEERHVRLGIGRDYGDVPPNRGVYRGAAAEEIKVRVQLRQMSPGELEFKARAAYPASRVVAVALRPKRAPQIASIIQQVDVQQQQQQQQ
jgi:transglutaminase-like putative cysteine protease